MTDQERIEAFKNCWDARTDNPSPFAKAFVVDVLTGNVPGAVGDWVGAVAWGPDSGSGGNCFGILTDEQRNRILQQMADNQSTHNPHTPQ